MILGGHELNGLPFLCLNVSIQGKTVELLILSKSRVLGDKFSADDLNIKRPIIVTNTVNITIVYKQIWIFAPAGSTLSNYF